MSTPLPPIYRDCRRLLVLTGVMVRRFSRYHKYTVGTDLRQAAMTMMRTVNQAVHDKARQAQHVQALAWRVDDYKLTLQLGMDVGVFAHGPQGSTGQGRYGRDNIGPRGPTMTKPCYLLDAWPRRKCAPSRRRTMRATQTTAGMSISIMATSTTTATTTTRFVWCVPVCGAQGADR